MPKDVEVNFLKSSHGTNYSDPYLRYKNIDTYFFKDKANGNIYRWSTKKEYYFNTNTDYKMSFKETGIINEYGIEISYVKNIKEYAKNTYGAFIWRDKNN